MSINSFLADLPLDWPTPPVYARFSVRLGKMLDEKRIRGTHLAPYLRNVDVQWDFVNMIDLPEMDFSEEDREKFSLLKGDLLVCEGGDVGRTAVWDGVLEECYYQKAIHRLRPITQNDDPRFFRYFMWVAVNLGVFTQSTASTIQHLTAEKLRVVRYPAPPLGQQREIADYLDKETARLNELAAAKERVIGLLAEKRRALITRAVIRGLDSGVPLRDSGIPWLGDIPMHWETTRLKFVAEVRGGLTIGKNYGASQLVEYPYLRVANVQDGHLDLSEVTAVRVPHTEVESCLLQSGDVLMNEGGDADKLGRGCIWFGEITPCLHQNHVFAVRPRLILSEWLNAWTSTEGAKSYFESRAKQSTNLASISATNIKELPVPLPPAQEQRAIVAHIATETAKIDALRLATERTIALLKERRAALIAAAVTGKLSIDPESTARMKSV